MATALVFLLLTAAILFNCRFRLNEIWNWIWNLVVVTGDHARPVSDISKSIATTDNLYHPARRPRPFGISFESCLQEVQNGTWGLVGGTDNTGHPVLDISMATGITYNHCLRGCGDASEPFVWSKFSQDFASWLLPWLALVSQLPFGANDKLDNLVTVLLTVGSPVLAGYSLALNALNGRWIARRFGAYDYPNVRYAVQILSSLQQSPLTVTTTNSLLASLVVLPENDEWWRELAIWLNYTHTWSVSAVSSIAWVIIAYVFMLVNSFMDNPTAKSEVTGLVVGSLWIWLLPIVIGWLQISPKCDSLRVRQAIERANKIAYVATSSGVPQLASGVSRQHAIHAISLPSSYELWRCDERSTAPIYNYSRFLPWTQAVEEVCQVYRVASDRAHRHCSVKSDADCKTSEKFPAPENRMGTLAEVDAYCLSVGEPVAAPRSPWGHAVWSRLILASLFALFLQWGTVGAAIAIAWRRPTLGKRYHGH
jgi:hypothetical protein